MINSQNSDHLVRFSNYLPNPLKVLAKKTPGRQLVEEINCSSLYLEQFPILSRLDNLKTKWEEFSERVSLYAVTDYTDRKLPFDEWQARWTEFHLNFSDLVDILTAQPNDIISVSREVMALWPINFAFLDSRLTVTDKEVLQYVDDVMNPSSNNIWEDFADVTESVIDDYIRPHINTIANSRAIRQDTDPTVLNLTAKMLGLNFRDEILDAIGPDRLATIIPLIGQFYEVASTDDFIKLIELCVCSKVMLEHLYSRDYVNFKSYEEFLSVPNAKLLTPESTGNDWFKTTHVNLYVEYTNARRLVAKMDMNLGTTVFDIVKYFLPVNIVIGNFGLFYELTNESNAPSIYLCGTIDTVSADSDITNGFHDPSNIRI